MATQKTVVEVDIQGTEKVESMRTQMRKLREELARLPEGTAEFNKVQRELGVLTDKMGDLSKSVNTLSGDPLERLNNSFSMIGSSILSLDFGQAQTGLKGMTSAVKDFKFKDATTAIKGFSTTIFDLGKALLLNPLFSIPAAIVLLIQNLDDLTKMGGKVGAFFGAIKNQIDAVWNSVVAFLDATGIIDSKAEERNKKAEKDAKEAAERQKKREEQAKKDAEKLQHEKEKLAEEAAKKEAERIKKTKEEQKSLSDFLKSEQEKRYQESLTEQERELRQIQLAYDEKKKLAHNDKKLLRQLEDEYQQQVTNVNNKYAKKRAADELAVAKKTLDLLKQIQIEQISEQEALSQEIQNLQQGARATEIQGVQDEYFTKIETAKKLGLDTTALEEEQKKQVAGINKKYDTEEFINAQHLQNKKLELAMSVANALTTLMDAVSKNDKEGAKRRFKINKALGIAQASISTYLAVNAALTAGGNPAKLATGEQFVEAGVALAVGLANVAKISKTKFDDGGSTTAIGGGGAGGNIGGMGGNSQAPAVDLSYLNKGSNKAQPVQAYVLATNVSSAQEAEQKIKDQSKIIK
jgi:hypothetical protein